MDKKSSTQWLPMVERSDANDWIFQRLIEFNLRFDSIIFFSPITTRFNSRLNNRLLLIRPLYEAQNLKSN